MLASKAMSWDNVVPASFEFTHRLLVAAYLLTCSRLQFRILLSFKKAVVIHWPGTGILLALLWHVM